MPRRAAFDITRLMEDLSRRHLLLTDLFEETRPPSQLALDDEQIASFHENGFLKGVRVLTPRQIDGLLDELEPLLDPARPSAALFHEYHSNESADPDRVLVHALGAWRIAPAFHDLVWNLRCLVPASQLLGGAVRLWHDQLFVKPAHHGGVVAWHQDYSYWTRSEPMAHLTCWIPLDDVSEANGGLQYVPGSHRWSLLPVTGLTTEMDAIRGVLSPAQLEAFVPVPMELERGVASFHHPLTVHGSLANDSAHPRRAIALNFCLDGTKSATNEPLLEGVPVIPSGETLAGQFFPLLYEP